MKYSISEILEFYEFETIEEAAERCGFSPKDICRYLEEMYEDDLAWLS